MATEIDYSHRDTITMANSSIRVTWISIDDVLMPRLMMMG